MKHPIYAILLTVLITFTFWSESNVNNDDKLEEKIKLDSLEKQEDINTEDSLSAKTAKSQMLQFENRAKKNPSSEESALLKENKEKAGSAKKNISLPSDKQ